MATDYLADLLVSHERLRELLAHALPKLQRATNAIEYWGESGMLGWGAARDEMNALTGDIEAALT